MKLTEKIYNAIQAKGDDFVARSKREIVTISIGSAQYDVRPGFMKAHFEGHENTLSYIRLDDEVSWGNVSRPKNPGTPPDTSLHLGDARRAWLKDHGGIQPTITHLIDDAMKS